MYDHINGILYEDCVVTLQGEPLTILTGEDHSEGWFDPENPVILSFTTPEPSEPETPAVPVTSVAKNEWQFTMPAYAVVAKIEYDTELELQEENVNTAVLADWDGYEADITLQRKLVAGSWNTLAVPFNVSSDALTALNTILTAQGGSFTVKQLTSSEIDGKTLTLNFDDADEMEAGKPYLVMVTKEVNLANLPAAIQLAGLTVNPFHDAEISMQADTVETDFVYFIPTLGKTLVTGPENDEDNEQAVLFVTENNELKNPAVVNDPENQSSYMKGFRAFFQLKDVPAGVRSFALNIDGETTGISLTPTNYTNDTNSVYDLQGRQIVNRKSVNRQFSKGVYIQNGKKVVVK
jgi:hypothetical protein